MEFRNNNNMSIVIYSRQQYFRYVLCAEFRWRRMRLRQQSMDNNETIKLIKLQPSLLCIVFTRPKFNVGLRSYAQLRSAKCQAIQILIITIDYFNIRCIKKQARFSKSPSGLSYDCRINSFHIIRRSRNTSACSFFLGMRINRIFSHIEMFKIAE